MNALEAILARRILALGPITVADFMTAALCHPRYGYYRQESSLIGAEGDFTTAPEISQLFGEMIGAWLIDCWEKMGRPVPVRLVELGPGRGTLMADALRVGRLAPGFLSAIDLRLVEINPGFRRLQAERLAPYRPCWDEALAAVPDGPLLLVANEFFDALPVRQLVLANGAWRERLVGWEEHRGFHFVASPRHSPFAALVPSPDAPESAGSVFEFSPASVGVAAEIATRICRHGGAALVIDYGKTLSTAGESLQAAGRHQKLGIFDRPGEIDLSAHADFDAIGRTAAQYGGVVFGPSCQDKFLIALGIETRAARLKQRASLSQRDEIDGALARLTGEAAMGTLFRAMAIVQANLLPAGFPTIP